MVTVPAHLRAHQCRLDDLVAVCSQHVELHDYAHAADVVDDVVVFHGATLRDAVVHPARRDEVLAELATVLSEGPGVFVVTDAVPVDVVARATTAFEQLIADQRAQGLTAGDHFAAPGANDRVWNALEKLALHDPDTFVDYYASDILALVSQAWLGPGYQVTSQINLVHPGGQAQSPHRDYHLGFMSDEQAEQFPAHTHQLSPLLTLQGAVAHGDMPVASGPTKLLPHSQKYPLGYLAWRRPEFIDYFERHHVQLPLKSGDAVFFNPALFHAAGSNHTGDVHRMANLLQVSSAMGRAMESVDRGRMSSRVYPVLCNRAAAGWPEAAMANAVAACAEAYAFPTNLDRDPPVSGLAPASQADLLHQAMHEGWSADQLEEALAALDWRRRTD